MLSSSSSSEDDFSDSLHDLPSGSSLGLDSGSDDDVQTPRAPGAQNRRRRQTLAAGEADDEVARHFGLYVEAGRDGLDREGVGRLLAHLRAVACEVVRLLPPPPSRSCRAALADRVPPRVRCLSPETLLLPLLLRRRSFRCAGAPGSPLAPAPLSR